MRCNRFKRFTSQKGANYSHRLAAGVDPLCRNRFDRFKCQKTATRGSGANPLCRSWFERFTLQKGPDSVSYTHLTLPTTPYV